jgi:hypothetical protein
MVIHAILLTKQNNTLVSCNLPLEAAQRVSSSSSSSSSIELNFFISSEDLLGEKSCHEAHVDEQLLTEAQEGILVNWVKVQGCCSVPMTYTSVAMCTGAISGKQIGATWPKWFHKHHPV